MGSLTSIIDRRVVKGKSAENRKKFLDRVRESVKEAMPSILNKGSLKDIAKDGGSVNVRKKTIQEPTFVFGKGGDNEHVLPGNKEYVAGDKIKKQGGSGRGSGGPEGSDQGGGEDDFVVQISREEFLNYLFEDLELPDLIRKELAEVTETQMKQAGYSTTGTPARLSVVRSMKMAQQRRIAMRSGSKAELEDAKALLAKECDPEKRRLIELAIAELEEKIRQVPFIDELDLRYRTMQEEKKPITHATMVCIMDNSGSMGEREKTLSRKFFYLLYLFLNRKYKAIDLVFIHHTEKAREVSEEEFFSTRESGGTIVSSALDLLQSMIGSRIDPGKTNIYVCQCSDGDNFSTDNAACEKALNGGLLDAVQYWAYIQIEREGYWSGDSEAPGRADTLWETYRKVSETHRQFALRRVGGESDIYPVFRKLFEKKPAGEGGGA